MCKGGLTARQMSDIRKQATAEGRAHTAMMYRAAGYAYKNQGDAA